MLRLAFVLLIFQTAFAQVPTAPTVRPHNGNAWIDAKKDFKAQLEACPLSEKPPIESGYLPFPCSGVDDGIYVGEKFNGYIYISNSRHDINKYVTMCGGKWSGEPCNIFKYSQEKEIKIKCQKTSGYFNWICKAEGSAVEFTCGMSQGAFSCSGKNGSFAIKKNDPRGNLLSVQLPQGGWGPVSKLDFRLAR